MKTLSISTDRREVRRLLVYSAVFVALSIWMLADGHWLGWAGLAFFGSALAIFAKLLADSRPRLVIDDRGVTDRTLGVGRIDYGDIEAAWFVGGGGAGCICLALRDPGKYLRRASRSRRALVWLNRRVGDTEFSLNLTCIEADADQVFAQLQERWERARLAAGQEEAER